MWKPLDNSFYGVCHLVARFRRQIEQIKGLKHWLYVGIKHIRDFSAFHNDLESLLLYLFEKYGLHLFQKI